MHGRLIAAAVLGRSFGILIICFGLLLLWIWLESLRTYLLLAAPVVPIAQARAGDRVHLRGRVKVAGDDPLRTPIAQREAVYYDVVVQGYYGDWSKGAWGRIWSQTRHCPFFLDDGSGQQAAVHPEGAVVLVDEKEVARNNAAAVEFLRAQGVDDARRPLRVLVRALAKDADVHAVGLAVRSAGLASNAYRDSGGQPPLTLRRVGRDRLLLSTAADGKPRLVTRYHPGASTPFFALVFVGMGLYMVLAFGLGLWR
jgi:hypothetical protein